MRDMRLLPSARRGARRVPWCLWQRAGSRRRAGGARRVRLRSAFRGSAGHQSQRSGGRAGLRRRRAGDSDLNTDPFGTAALREGVLAAWRGSPTRFREDANTESDLAALGYADRLLVELAQNAADAAQRAAVPGYLCVTVEGGELRAANTGAPLDCAGVAALAALRASAKREGGTVGRFGVGFAAVLGGPDAPQIVSRSAAVVNPQCCGWCGLPSVIRHRGSTLRSGCRCVLESSRTRCSRRSPPRR